MSSNPSSRKTSSSASALQAAGFNYCSGPNIRTPCTPKPRQKPRVFVVIRRHRCGFPQGRNTCSHVSAGHTIRPATPPSDRVRKYHLRKEEGATTLNGQAKCLSPLSSSTGQGTTLNLERVTTALPCRRHKRGNPIPPPSCSPVRSFDPCSKNRMLKVESLSDHRSS